MLTRQNIKQYVGGPRGGGTASLRVSTQNKTTDPAFCATTALSHCPSWVTASFLMPQKQFMVITVVTAVHPQQASVFSYPDTITLITLIKTLIIAYPGYFSWTRQTKNYCSHRKGPLLRVLGSVTAPLFLSW